MNNNSTPNSSNADFFLVGRCSDRSFLLNSTGTDSNSYAFTSVPNFSAIRGTFRNKTIFFNGHFTYEINDFFHEAIDNVHTLYIIRELKKFMDVLGGNAEDLSTFFGCALRIVVETPIELGELGREEETKNVTNCADNETTAKADDEKKNDGKDDSESDGNESESDESIMNDAPFFKFIRAIVNNFLELSTSRSRHGRLPDDESCVKRSKFCAKFRAKIFNDWSEVLRILRIPVTEDDGHADDADAKFVLHDVFVLRCARGEMDTLPSDLNALFASDQFDCRVICVEKPPEKVAKYL
uniref:BTB domain-containing protein n=1 Tax=Globodera rostochiensis TaxID=31243 RepID=A0A914I1C6_GLORO